MSTTTPTAKQPEPKTAQGDAKSIAVARMYFNSPTDLPGKAVADVLQGTDREEVFGPDAKRINHRHAWIIEYTPAHRHFKITYVPAGQEKAETVRMVHETAVKAWDPA